MLNFALKESHIRVAVLNDIPLARWCLIADNIIVMMLRIFLKPADNYLSVKIRDLGLGFGPSACQYHTAALFVGYP